MQKVIRRLTSWAYGSRWSPPRMWRLHRLQAFVRLVKPPPGARIIDLGGSEYMWDLIDHDFEVTIINLPDSRPPPRTDRYAFIWADACDLRGILADNSFDVAFSNSVIEHVGDEPRQRAFASEARRLAPAYWVQTPSERCPIEAHTGVPFYWRRSPEYRARLMAKWKTELPAWAEMIDGTTIVPRRSMESFFPDGTIFVERVLGLEKSSGGTPVERVPARQPGRAAAAAMATVE